MGKFDHILIFSDIDGTFIGANPQAIAKNEEAVRYFCKEGGSFTFATGRMEKNVPHAIPNVGELANFPVLLSNGAFFYDYATGTRSESQFMESESLSPLMEYIMEKFPGIGIRATVPGGFWFIEEHPLLMREFRRLKDCTEKRAFSEWDTETVYKVVLRGSEEELLAIQKDITERFGKKFMIIMSERDILEVQRSDVSKGSAIERIRTRLAEAGTPKAVVAVGDYENDLEMLRAADIAACPANAIPSVQAVARIKLCDCNEGAIADLIRYLEEHPELLA